MGIIAILLYTSGYLGHHFYVPFWVIMAAHAAIALGTLAGGWRIVKTMGMRITKLRPSAGSAPRRRRPSPSSGPPSGHPGEHHPHHRRRHHGRRVHSRLSAVRWGLARRIVWAWILTIPSPP